MHLLTPDGDEDDVVARARARLVQTVREAREGAAAFARFVGRVEGGKPARVGPVHEEWHRHMDENPLVVLFAPIGHGKSNQFTRWRIMWEIGRNPNLRVAIISSSQGLPGKLVGAIKADITRNQWLHMVFPNLRPSREVQKQWSSSIVVERTDNSPDPTIQIFGPHGKILGSRLDLIVFDDVCTQDNTRTAHSRAKLWEWITSEVLSRLPLGERGRVWALGHVWHDDDALHRLGRQPDFRLFKYGCTVRNEAGEERPLIPEMWTMKGLRRRASLLGPVHAKMMLYNELADAAEGRMRRAWFDACLRRGRGHTLLPHWNPSDAPTYTGVDLGVRTVGAVTCMFTVALLPEGTRKVIDVRSGHWPAPEILRQVEDVHRRFGSIIAVENNTAQDFLLQFASELSTIPLQGRHTGNNKHHPMFGVESLGLELSQGKWMIPCSHDLVPEKEVSEWIDECVAYSPDQHMGDRLSASWICREQIRLSPSGSRMIRASYEDHDFLSR